MPAGSDAAVPDTHDPVTSDWSTGFEADFCDYTRQAGFCYGNPLATYETVTSPVHTGLRAAAFSIDASDPDAHQARCVRQGVLPEAAYYGAWYFVPEQARNAKLWNLVHFQGGDMASPHGLWDISLVNSAGAALEPIVFGFLNGRTYYPQNTSPIPIGAWFHLELYLKRAAEPTGEVALFMDGRQLLRITDIITDDSDWGQWYVGNLATDLTPSKSTLYVDDVSIRASR